MVSEIDMKLCVTEPDFLKENICRKNGPEVEFFEVIENIGQHLFFLIWVYNESVYYLPYSCTNFISGKNLIPRPFKLQDVSID